MNRQVSVIIPNLNSPLIHYTLDSLRSQSSASRISEILVIGLDAEGLIEPRAPVRFIDTGRPVTAPVARNIGIKQACGGYLAFIDADCIADEYWLERLLEKQQAGCSIVGGSVAFPSRPYWQLCYNLTMFHEFLVTAPAGSRANMGTLNLCVAREVVERVGLMDEQLDRAQDTDWTLRMRRHGYRLEFTPDAIVTHLPNVNSLSHILATWHRSGMYNAWVRRQYSDLIARPPLDSHPGLQRVLSPLIAFAVTVRIFARNIGLLRYAHTFPVLFATKVAWCWGASKTFDPHAGCV